MVIMKNKSLYLILYHQLYFQDSKKHEGEMPRKRLSVKERLGVMPGGVTGGQGIKVTHYSRDPRSIVDYSDIDLSTALDLF